MNVFIEWFLKNSELAYNLIAIIVIVTYAIVLIWKGKWDKLRADAFKLMMMAEATYTGSKQGKEKFKAVFDLIWSMVPSWFKIFVTKDSAKEKLQEWYNEIKDYMDNGKCDNSTNTTNLF